MNIKKINLLIISLFLFGCSRGPNLAYVEIENEKLVVYASYDYTGWLYGNRRDAVKFEIINGAGKQIINNGLDGIAKIEDIYSQGCNSKYGFIYFNRVNSNTEIEIYLFDIPFNEQNIIRYQTIDPFGKCETSELAKYDWLKRHPN